MPNAERVWIESDERGFELWIETDEDEPVCFNIQNIDLDTFYDQVKGRIGPYLQEKEAAFAEFRQAVQGSGRLTDAGYENPRYYDTPGSAFLCNPDESGGYAADDPKHPDWHSIHVDLWDSRSGK